MARLTPKVKALRLAIKDLKRINQEYYAHGAQAVIYGFAFAVHAKRHYDEHIEAIKIIQEMLNECEQK